MTVVGVLALAIISVVGRIHLHSGNGSTWSSGSAFHTGEVKVNRRDGLSYVWIGPGSFRMGCSAEDSDCEPDEQPHQVTLTQGYWIGKTEVTAGAFKRFSMATGARMPVAHGSNGNWSDETRPISNVGWDDAGAYCRWAEARLPTEAEWEMAARSGTTLARYGPLDEVAWHKDNSGGSSHAVAGKRPNPYGLVDVLGNVWEWTADRYASNAWSGAAAVNPAGPASGHFRVLRGGSWLRSVAEVRVSDRYPVLPDSPDHGTGFRCVADEMP